MVVVDELSTSVDVVSSDDGGVVVGVSVSVGTVSSGTVV